MLLEAMLSRLPVVATRVSAVPEIVVDGATGMLAAPGDADAVAAALVALLRDDARRRALGEAGYRRARSEFSVARMADAHARRLPRGGRVREVRLRELVAGSPPGADRVALLSLWFHGHNNPRYAELLPRLERLDACLLRLSESADPARPRLPRLPALRRPLHVAALGPAARRYRNLLTLDFEQLATWRGAAVMDADDPFFPPREVELLNRPGAARVRRHRGARRANVRVARRREAVGRDPAGRQPLRRDPGAAGRRRAREAAGRGGARLDGGAPADRGRPRRQRALQRRPPARAVGADPRPRARTRGSGSSAGRASACAGASPAATTSSSSGGCRAARRSRPRRSSTSSVTRARADMGIRAAKVGRAHRPRRPDGLVRLRGDGEPARDGRRRARAGRAGASSTPSSACSRTTPRGPGWPQPRRAPAATSTGTCSRGASSDEVLDRYLPS